MTTYVHLGLWRISRKCNTFKKKNKKKTKKTCLNVIERFYVRKEASFDEQLYNKHTIFPQHKFDAILKNKTFHPTFCLMPSTFYIPIHFSPTPHSQTMPFLLSVLT